MTRKKRLVLGTADTVRKHVFVEVKMAFRDRTGNRIRITVLQCKSCAREIVGGDATVPADHDCDIRFGTLGKNVRVENSKCADDKWALHRPFVMPIADRRKIDRL